MKWHFRLKCLRSLKRSVCGQAEGELRPDRLPVDGERPGGGARLGGGAKIPELFDIFLHKAETGPIIAPMANLSTELAWPLVLGRLEQQTGDVRMQLERRSDFFYSKRP